MENLFGISRYYQKAKEIHHRYEKALMPLMLVLGFLVDYVTFASVQISISLALLLGYWIVAGLAIIFTSLCDTGKIPPRLQSGRIVAFLLIQYSFGSLLSGSLVFYWFSGAFSISWPIMIGLATLMFVNDAFRSYFSRPSIQLCVYFFTTFSLAALALPLLLNSISAWIFGAATALSIILFSGYLWIIFSIRKFTRSQKNTLLISIFTIAALMNVLYFTNIIPPIPLSIREAGVYHDVKRTSSSYILTGEPETFWQQLIPGQTLHVTPGEKVYIYTAIFAPAKLQTSIVHRWQHYNEVEKKWITIDKLSFNISGGIQNGYKGYSWMSNLQEGKWRVYVETSRGQALGRISFSIINVQQATPTHEIIK